MGSAISNLCRPDNVSVSVPKEKIQESRVVSTQMSIDGTRRNNLVSLDDFIRIDVVGEGGYGKVFLVKKKDNGKLYALKKVKKKLFNNVLRLKDAINEKNIMIRSSHPFIVKLYFSFQDKKNLYYCMEYVEGGVLFKYIRDQGHLSEYVTKFYVAQVVMALKYLHEECGIIYRDLKPENLLLDDMGYLKVTDFGLSTSNLNSGRGDNNKYMWNLRIYCTRNY